jgi:Ca2+-binding EF-hand superfamily protein
VIGCDAFYSSNLITPQSVFTTEDAREAFLTFDKDGSGTISVHELRSVLATVPEGIPLTEEEVEAFCIEADLNGDGVINYAEFIRMIQQG